MLEAKSRSTVANILETYFLKVISIKSPPCGESDRPEVSLVSTKGPGPTQDRSQVSVHRRGQGESPAEVGADTHRGRHLGKNTR